MSKIQIQKPKQNNGDYAYILEDLYCTTSELPTGIIQYTAWANKWDVPVGLVWVKFRTNHEEEKVAEILHCYTIEWARRYGVCKFVFNSILKSSDVDLLITQNGSDTGGQAVIQAFGFQYNKDVGLWYFRLIK